MDAVATCTKRFDVDAPFTTTAPRCRRSGVGRRLGSATAVDAYVVVLRQRW